MRTRKIKSNVVNKRPIIKRILIPSFLIIFIAIVNIGGCGGEGHSARRSRKTLNLKQTRRNYSDEIVKSM
jgi:hypothetical protein